MDKQNKINKKKLIARNKSIKYKGGNKMEALLVDVKQNKLLDLKNRAFIRKQRKDLRHNPNISDINNANKNAKDLSLCQMEAIQKSEG